MTRLDAMQRAREWSQRRGAEASEQERLRRLRGTASLDVSQPLDGWREASYVTTVETLPEATDDDVGRIIQVRNNGAVDTLNIGVSQADGTVVWVPLNIDLPDTTLSWIAAFQTTFGGFAYGVAIDPAGNIWVANAVTNYVRKYDNAGNYLSVQVGGTGSGDGQLNQPTGIACDSAGNLYVCDQNNNRVQKFSSTGTYLLQFGSSGTGNGQFRNVTGVAVDSADRPWVADSFAHRVQCFTTAGVYQSQFGSLGTGNGQFNAPRCLAFDVGGANLYVSDANNNRVQKFSVSGTTATYASQFGSKGNGNGQFGQPYGIAVGSDGTVYVVDAGNSRVQAFTSAGEFVNRFGTYGTALGQFKSPSYVAVDAFGGVWTIDFQRAQRWTVAGQTTLSSYTQFDDFNGGNTSSGTIGELGWATAGNGSVTTQNSTAAHAGIVQLASGGTSGNSQRLAYGPFLFDQLNGTRFIFRPNDTGNVYYRVGLLDTPTGPSDGLYAEVDTNQSDATWKAVKTVGGVSTRTDSGLAWTGAVWYRVVTAWAGSGTATLTIRRMDTGQETVVTQTGLSTSAQLYLAFVVQTRSGTAKTLDVDAALLTTQNITRV